MSQPNKFTEGAAMAIAGTGCLTAIVLFFVGIFTVGFFGAVVLSVVVALIAGYAASLLS